VQQRRATTSGFVDRGPKTVSSIRDSELRRTQNAVVPTMVPYASKTQIPSETGAELAVIVQAWPSLPDGLRQSILAMIQATRSEDSAS
jgi:hypothetical protein